MFFFSGGEKSGDEFLSVGLHRNIRENIQTVLKIGIVMGGSTLSSPHGFASTFVLPDGSELETSAHHQAGKHGDRDGSGYKIRLERIGGFNLCFY